MLKPRQLSWTVYCAMQSLLAPAKQHKSVQFSSVQFAKINVVLSAIALQDHDTVISVIDAVVAGKEMS